MFGQHNEHRRHYQAERDFEVLDVSAVCLWLETRLDDSRDSCPEGPKHLHHTSVDMVVWQEGEQDKSMRADVGSRLYHIHDGGKVTVSCLDTLEVAHGETNY